MDAPILACAPFGAELLCPREGRNTMAVTAAALSESCYPADESERVLNTTVGGILRDAAQAVPDQPALIGGHPDPAQRRRWTYGELLQDAEHRRPCIDGRPRLLPHRGSAERHDHPRRGEHLSPGDRAAAVHPLSRRRRGGG